METNYDSTKFYTEKEFFCRTFSKGKEKAFRNLMEYMCGYFLQAESIEKLKAENYERNNERTDFHNGTRDLGRPFSTDRSEA